MATAREIAAHLAGAIDQAPLTPSPFDHIALEQPFSDRVYPELLAHLPADAYFRELKHSDAMLADGRSARLQFPLLHENIRRLPVTVRAFWDEVADGVSSATVAIALRAKFRAALEGVTGKAFESIRLRAYATLFRDIGGYKISIHPDSPRKAVTMQFYLPADASQPHLGTLFHARSTTGDYTLARAMAFAPNSGYAFAVTPTSYHSVNPIRNDDKPRNSLMVIVNYDRGAVVEGFKTARAKVRSLFDRVAHPGRPSVEAGEGRYE